MLELRARRVKKIDSNINIVPYIDVMLVLLIIFMMTTPIIEQGIEVDLPKAGSGEVVDFSNHYPSIVSIDKTGNYYLNTMDSDDNTEKLELDILAARLIARREIYPNIQIFVRADKTVAYAKVVALMSYLQSSGIEKVGLLTESINQ
jgi:biopolymer transport protein TolR